MQALKSEKTPHFSMASEHDRTIAIITHILGYFTSFIGPLVVLIASESEAVKQHARRAFNWQMSLVIYLVALTIVLVVSVPLTIVLIGIFTGLIAALAIAALSIADIVFIIIAAVRASEGRIYEYPVTIRFLKDPVVQSVSAPKNAPRKPASAKNAVRR